MGTPAIPPSFSYHDPMLTLTLRRAMLADNSFIKRVFTAAMPLYQQLMPGSFEANLVNMDILTEKGLDINATGLDGWILTSSPSEKAAPAPDLTAASLGFAGIGALNPAQVYMAALYLLPQYQHQGYGSWTLQQLEKDYRARQFTEMLLLVHKQADWAKAFYLRAGYREISDQQPEIVAYGGEHFLHLYEPGLILLGKEIKDEHV